MDELSNPHTLMDHPFYGPIFTRPNYGDIPTDIIEIAACNYCECNHADQFGKCTCDIEDEPFECCDTSFIPQVNYPTPN